MASDPLLDHLEKVLGDSYRKEIDQEENVWRSLPFFAATLALQLAALVQVRDWLIAARGAELLAAGGVLAAAALATLAALVFLALSVWPARFQYIAAEPVLRDYAATLRRATAPRDASPIAGAEPRGGVPTDGALAAFKTALVDQYATATLHNRRINQRRARWRGRAALATLLSVVLVLFLVAFPFAAHSLRHE